MTQFLIASPFPPRSPSRLDQTEPQSLCIKETRRDEIQTPSSLDPPDGSAVISTFIESAIMRLPRAGALPPALYRMCPIVSFKLNLFVRLSPLGQRA